MSSSRAEALLRTPYASRFDDSASSYNSCARNAFFYAAFLYLDPSLPLLL